MSGSSSKIKIPLGVQSEGAEAPESEGPAAHAPGSLPPLPDQEGRSTAVWRQWLSSMASDAEAALAAAIAYRDMDSVGRERWLSSLEFDAPAVGVPAVALYAPLLAVEQDPERRERLLDALGSDQATGATSGRSRALSGSGRGDLRVLVVAIPLYLEFFQVLACAVQGGKFVWVKHDPIVGASGVPQSGDLIEAVRLETSPVKSVIDELAHAVLSHKRGGHVLPEALFVLGDLLGPLGP